MRLFFLFTFLISLNTFADCPEASQIRGEYLLRFSEDVTTGGGSGKPTTSLQDLLRTSGATQEVIHSKPKQLLKVFSKATADEVPASVMHVKNLSSTALATIVKDARVLSVEPNCIVRIASAPNDPQFSQQWFHQIIHSQEAWDVTTGSASIIVAVSDTGVDYTHEDLKANMWVNTKEIAANGVDDDGNGCIDDIYGCDFGDGDGDPKPGYASGARHGTHVAGIIGAVGNNSLGVTGVAWKVKIMAAKGFQDGAQTASTANLIKTLYYAANNGARVVNASWTGDGRPGYAEAEVARYLISKGVLPVAAAGNATADAANYSPAGLTDVFTVGATNSLDQLATFSNFGSQVKIVAPGGDLYRNGLGQNESILSTYFSNPADGNLYAGLQGTSMASPVVAGVAALVLSVNPNLTVAQLKDILLRSADMITVRAADANRTTFNYPRVNAARAVQLAKIQPSPTPINPTPTPPPTDCDPNSQNCANSTQRSSESAPAPTAKMAGGCGSIQATAHDSPASVANVNLWYLFLLLPAIFTLFLRRRVR